MGNNLYVALEPLHTELYSVSAGPSVASHAAPQDWRVHVLRGSARLAAMRPMLAELSRRTGQENALDSLEYLLGGPTMRGKTPYLVLVGLRAGVSGELATAGDLEGAVLLHEYQIAGRGARVFATHDITGQRTVFAPAAIRIQVAQIAACALAEQGALMALISIEGKVQPEGLEGLQELSADLHSSCRLALRTRAMPHDLVVEASFQATLANLGKHTRRNLRYYRRRAEADLGSTFVPQVEISLPEFLEMNRNSTNPGSDSDAAWRYECLADLGRVIAGVKAGNGQWLSLVGGRRYGGVTQIEWQMNRAGLPRYSLSTVMRSYLLEHEAESGTVRLIFLGGTPHSMRHSLAKTDVLDLLVVRRSLPARLLLRFAGWIFPKSNFLGNVLQDADLIWRE
jgi:hypothetical protein